MENAPPPYSAGDFSKSAPYPTNPNFPPGQASYPPYQTPYPPTQAPYPPTQAPYPPTQGPYPPTQATYPVTQGAYPAQPGYPVTQPPMNQNPVQTVIVRAGSCPACGIGHVSKELTCCGVCCAIIFFPIGIICCIAMMDSRCNNCHAKF